MSKFFNDEENLEKIRVSNNLTNEVEKEWVDHPDHYNREGSIECIEEMLAVFGSEAVMWFSLLSAWKYRYRAGEKSTEDRTKDLKKSDWYIKKYIELKHTV